MAGALAGIRVLDLSDSIAGRPEEEVRRHVRGSSHLCQGHLSASPCFERRNAVIPKSYAV